MGSGLPLTLINAVGHFSIVFYKFQNSSVIKVFVLYCLTWVNSRLDPISFLTLIFPDSVIFCLYSIRI